MVIITKIKKGAGLTKGNSIASVLLGCANTVQGPLKDLCMRFPK